MSIGQKIKELREKNNIGLRELAEQINISSGYLSQIESEIKQNPSYDILKSIAEYFDVSISYLLTDNHKWYDTLPPEYKKFVKEENIEYLKAGLKAKKAGVSPDAVLEIIDIMKKYQKKKKE